MTKRARILLATAERYRMMAGTITDPMLARRLIDYADELAAKAKLIAHEREDDAVGVMDDA